MAKTEADQEPTQESIQEPSTETPNDPTSEQEPESTEPDKRSSGIPRTRFDAVNERRKVAEAEAAKLQRQLEALRDKPAQAAAETAPSADEQLLRQQLAAATRANVTAIGDGDLDKAVDAQMSMLDLQAKISALHAPKQPVQDVAAAVREVNYHNALRDIKASHPVLDETTEQFDETMVLEVNDLFEAYVAAGKSKDEALAKAVRYVLPDAKTASNKPSSHDTQRNISNAQDAAPNIGRAGQAGADSKRINWGALSEEDFAAIPESKKKEARGDFLT